MIHVPPSPSSTPLICWRYLETSSPAYAIHNIRHAQIISIQFQHFNQSPNQHAYNVSSEEYDEVDPATHLPSALAPRCRRLQPRHGVAQCSNDIGWSALTSLEEVHLYSVGAQLVRNK